MDPWKPKVAKKIAELKEIINVWEDEQKGNSKWH